MGAVTLLEKHKLMEFENKMFRKIRVPNNGERNEARAKYRASRCALLTEYCLRIKCRSLRWAGHVVRMW